MRGCGLHLVIAWMLLFSSLVAAQPPADLKSLARQSLAKLDGEVSVPGVREPIEIIRDKWGVTHIYAKNEEDLFFAQGYAAAQDRLWQLYMWRMEQRRTAGGDPWPRRIRSRSGDAAPHVPRPIR
jgi:acyl-homoserine lactone acylase PvdQ